MVEKLAGKVLVAQGGGPTAVINQSLVGVVLEARKFNHISRVYGAVHGVSGIIDEDFLDLEDVARTFALLPELAARARVEMGEPGGARRGQRFGIHEGHHQHRATGVIDDDCAQQSLVVELGHEPRTCLALGLIIHCDTFQIPFSGGFCCTITTKSTQNPTFLQMPV